MLGDKSYPILLQIRYDTYSSKLKIYKTLIRPTVTYGSEAWALTRRNEQQLRILERKILRKIYGAIKEENGIW